MNKSLIVSIFVVLFSANAFSDVDCNSLAGGLVDAKVVKVKDGDTATVLLSEHGKTIDVRFFGIDTPESQWKGRWPAQRYSKQAKSYTVKKIGNRNVEIDFNGKGTWGRCVGEIFVDKSSLSLELVRNGLAWWYEFYAPSRSDLQKAQAQARSNKKGLWADSNPEAPWDYRRRH